MSERGSCCCPGGDCGPGPDRREFLGAASVAAFGVLQARGRQGQDGDHFVPADKRLPQEWIDGLTKRGPVQPWRGEQLRTIAMPCGGVGAGQLYVTGDGRLAQWWIANDARHSSYGGQTTIDTPDGKQGVCYATYEPFRPIEQGTLLAWRAVGGVARVESLDAESFPETSFLGEYPVATIDYERHLSPLPFSVRAEVFSPFVPLSARDSAVPCTMLRYTLHNLGAAELDVDLASYLRNPVLHAQRGEMKAMLRNVAVSMDGFVGVAMDAYPDPDSHDTGSDDFEVFADFEQGYGDWKIESGEALGDGPAAGTLPDQNRVSGFEGKRLVNTFFRGDDTVGVLVSPEFTVTRPFVLFRIGGGQDLNDLALHLEVVENGRRRRVRAATGQESERLREAHWDVSDLIGRRAVLVVRDRRTGPWGHVNVDYIRFSDAPPAPNRFSELHPQAGDMALVALAKDATAIAEVGSVEELSQWLMQPAAPIRSASRTIDKPALGAVVQRVRLAPGASATVQFALTWFFPNRRQRDDEGVGPGQLIGTDGPRVGNMYSNWFHSALSVAQHLAENGAELAARTFACRDALYRQTTLPGWLMQRIAAPLSTMATATVQWWESGRLWAWEGVGCCSGTCGHVWNYAQGMAWLFPELERSVRENQDFKLGLGLKDDGAIGFRGTPNYIWAGDAQGGYVLKAWREHRLSRDGEFLRRNWPAIKQALQFLIGQDGAQPDGLLEGRQHNTYDINFYGGNTMVGSLYLGALWAGAHMAKLRGDRAFAAQCEQLARRGAEVTMQQLWNGEYFVQHVPDDKQDQNYQYRDGCLSDQLLGNWFAGQVGLGEVYPGDAVQKALQSIWRYNWAPDIAPQAKAHRPERDFAKPGEAGLFTCTWPKSKHPGENGVRYRDEVWTGIEYQVAGDMLRQGMLTEGLSIVQAIHDRYDPAKHNPYNEVECGDHYARALASWSCLLSLSGFECDVPAGVFGFAPRITPDDFQSFFSAGTCWGTVAQQRSAASQTVILKIQEGQVRLAELQLEAPAGRKVATAELGTVCDDLVRAAQVPFEQDGTRVIVRPAAPAVLKAGLTPGATQLVVTLHFA